jgi:hypothetical protein
VRIIREERQHAEAERAEGAGEGALSRRGVLGGLAALPVLSSIGSTTPALAATATRPGSVSKGAGDLVRGAERRYNAPLLTPILSGFTEGWYELIHANGRADRVTWDAGKLPFLWLYGEFGGTNEAPYRNRFYTLALQPLSRNPYSRSTPIL